ncbi:N-acetylmuramic acid 6-phosphate etherase [bacterium]|nr:MAG: N-acetylmuramic acid 6-phosphate etherase [bacterium]
MKKVTEQPSNYDNLEKMSTLELLTNINNEDKTVPLAIEKVIPQMEKVVNQIVDRLLSGGRLFYMGAGTSGRLGVVDASELPPTYGVPDGLVIGLIAGGDPAIRKAQEFAEDDSNRGWKELLEHNITSKDAVLGIAASGTTPYVIGAMRESQKNGIYTSCITCNPDSPVAAVADDPIEIIVGPEFVTGSTRMKAGTAQKLALNMISTSVMIKLGRVQGNRMVNMQLTNNKLVDRGTLMVMEKTGLDYETANDLLLKYSSVKAAVEAHLKA